MSVVAYAHNLYNLLFKFDKEFLKHFQFSHALGSSFIIISTSRRLPCLLGCCVVWFREVHGLHTFTPHIIHVTFFR